MEQPFTISFVNAAPLLHTIARALNKVKLEAVLIGNAAAALQGSPVTTLDFDFMFRKTPGNMKKVRQLAKYLCGVVLRPYYPASDLYRLISDREGLQMDLMPKLHGIRSFASLRSRATTVYFDSFPLLVADLHDIIRSKKVANRPQDRAVLPLLEKTLREKLKEKDSTP